MGTGAGAGADSSEPKPEPESRSRIPNASPLTGLATEWPSPRVRAGRDYGMLCELVDRESTVVAMVEGASFDAEGWAGSGRGA
jgi:hypothetical protein